MSRATKSIDFSFKKYDVGGKSQNAVKKYIFFSDKMRPLVRVWVVAPVTDGLANQA